MEEETLDEILGGHLTLFQKKRGYRFSLDSILLAHFVSIKPRTCNIDLGCGSGIILLILAKRFPYADYIGLEIQQNLVSLAQRNVSFNKLEKRIKIAAGDARKIKNIFPPGSFDVILFNPPYRKLNSGKINPLIEKAIARHEITGSLRDFLRAAQYLLKPAGKVFTIYPAKRLSELIFRFRENSIEPKKMKLVFSGCFSAAEFVLLEGRIGGHEELKIEQPLFIYDEEKNYSKEMVDIFTELDHFPAGDGD